MGVRDGNKGVSVQVTIDTGDNLAQVPSGTQDHYPVTGKREDYPGVIGKNYLEDGGLGKGIEFPIQLDI